ncbi:DUF2306 domain-containing protein [Ensifer adhaerens]
MIELKRLRKILWLLMTLSAITVAILNSRFLWMDIHGLFHRALDHLENEKFELYLHLFTAPVLLVVGALLFFDRLPQRYPTLHRWGGRSYILTVLVTSIATLELSLNETEGPLTVFGFATLSILWFATAALAWLCAVERRYACHAEWMIRNYALTLTNVTFRAELHLLLWLGADFNVVYEPLRSLQFIPNLLLAEVLISDLILYEPDLAKSDRDRCSPRETGASASAVARRANCRFRCRPDAGACCWRPQVPLSS